tara:strand:+ start:2882 stop:3844 length:963 start_codon:yes stop_codon:yes gene_type:complete
MVKKVLVTGAGGFLGKSVCSHLKKLNNTYRLIPLRGKGEWDLTKQKHVDYVLQEFEPDIVVHLAATCGGIGINKENPGLFMYDNLSMGMNLIESCRKYGKLDKFIMVGTVCAYPKFTPVPFKEDDIWNGYPEETNAPYGIAKKTLMELLIAYEKQYGFNCANLIPVNMYGPNDNFDPGSSHVIPALILKFAKAIKNNHEPVEIWGTGQASREFLYVDDCARAICMALDTDTTAHPINIGTCSEITIKDLAHKLADIMGFEGSVFFNSSYPDGQPRRCLDVRRAQKVLNFKAETKLYQGLKETVSWFYKNEGKFVDHFSHI